MPQVDSKFILTYVQNPKARHKFYGDTCELAEAINVHASGNFPDDLIKERRPSETDTIQKYREKIWVAKTKPVFTKVYNALMKIPRSPDYSIQFDNETPARIADGESLKDYINEQIPNFGSLSNWYWNVAFRYYLIDANGGVLTMPVNFDSPDNEYLKPLPMVFTSESIIDYKEGEFIVLILSETERYEDEQKVDYYNGTKYLVVQPDIIQEFLYTPSSGKVTEVNQWQNLIGYIPFRSLRGICVDTKEGVNLYESRIQGIVPMLDEAVREYSDLQAEIVQHIHSTMWTYQPQQCKDCKGSGKVRADDGTLNQCRTCNGIGSAPMNPYEHLSVPLPKVGETPLSPPFMGYVEKNTAIAELQEKRIRQHIYDALASINMEFLAEVPLAESGVAKQVDREELYSFFHSIATDCCRILSEIIYDTNQWRYAPAGFSRDELELMLPAVIVPQRYDILNATILMDELEKMSTAKVDPSIINATQVDLVEKRFATDHTVRDKVKLKLTLDPFAGVPEENISLMKTFGAVSMTDVIIHANINEFVNRAMEEVKDFTGLDMKKQRDIMQKYAKEKETAMQANLLPAEPPTPPTE